MLPLNKLSSIPLYEQVYEYIKRYIEEGTYVRGQRLPSVRLLAKENGISKITVAQAYTQLATEGYIKSHNRSPYEVLDVPLISNGMLRKQILNQENLDIQQEKNTQYIEKTKSILYDFSTGAMDPEGFNFTRWKRFIGHVLREPEKLMGYGHIQGELPLREALTTYLREARSVLVQKDMITISSGAQATISMLASLLLALYKEKNVNHPIIAMQKRHLAGIGSIFSDYGFSVLTSDLKGIDLLEYLLLNKVQVYYCTPSHEGRTGQIMSIKDRHSLLKWAHEKQTFIIEDDYDSELRYYGKPMSSLQGLDQYQQVIYMGAPSKVLPPSIRLSYAVLPNLLQEIFWRGSERFRQSAGVMEQLVWAEYIRSGEWSKQIRRLRKHYQEKSRYMVKLIKEYFGSSVNVHKPEGGVYVSLHFAETTKVANLVRLAKEAGLLVKVEDQDILLSFSAISTKELPKAIEKLAKVWHFYL